MDHHICCEGTDKHVYKYLYSTEIPINPKHNFTNMNYFLHLNENNLLQRKIRQYMRK